METETKHEIIHQCNIIRAAHTSDTADVDAMFAGIDFGGAEVAEIPAVAQDPIRHALQMQTAAQRIIDLLACPSTPHQYMAEYSTADDAWCKLGEYEDEDQAWSDLSGYARAGHDIRVS